MGNAISKILTANYPGDPASLAWIRHPRDAKTYDALEDSTGQPLQPTPWAAAVQKLHTTSLPITEGVGANESVGIIGDFSQCLIGTVNSGLNIRILDSGSVTDSNGVQYNAASQLMRLVVAHLRADVALLRPSWFTNMTGITA